MIFTISYYLSDLGGGTRKYITHRIEMFAPLTNRGKRRVLPQLSTPKLIYLELSSARYPENDFKTFLTITILEIIYIVCQLGKISDRYVLLISSRYW